MTSCTKSSIGQKSQRADGQSESERVTYYKHNQTRAATISNSNRQKTWAGLTETKMLEHVFGEHDFDSFLA